MAALSSSTKRTFAVVVVVAATALGGAGCSASSGSSAGSSASGAASSSVETAHNNQDIEFAQMMIPHHEQAIVMADMVPSHTSNAELIALAAKIKAAQAPEIAQMKSWLVSWGAPASASAGSMDGHGHASGGDATAADGMMTSAQMMELEKANGAAFDKMWLQMMIEHHEGAVEMSNQELASGQNAQAKALAQAIITGQQAEIAQMQQMLKG